jgi:effector-binding domain-containing protein
VEARLRQIEQEEGMSKYDVVIKQIEPLRVASTRGVVATPPDQSSLWKELECYLEARGVHPSGVCLSLYHDEDTREHEWDIEVCEPIESELPETEKIKVRSLPEVTTAACVVHAGPFVTIGEAYEAIMKWIDANGYRIKGPGREVYVRASIPNVTDDQTGVSQTDPGTVTEIQFPVEKA